MSWQRKKPCTGYPGRGYPSLKAMRRIAASAALVAAAAIATFGVLPLLRGSLPAELAVGAFALTCAIAGVLNLAGAFKHAELGNGDKEKRL